LNTNFNIPTVLIAPLDWGLGHATRCIPLIKAFLANDYKVIIATNGKPEKILQQEFPELVFVKLKGYTISYSANQFWLPFKMAAQIPKILSLVKYEHQWLQTIIEQYKIDVVISDNRYGLYSNLIPSVFITHQLTIQTPFGWLTKLLQRINYRYINKFSACWIPDIEDNQNIAGVLSHPKKMPAIPVHYLGILSRFKKSNETIYQYKFCFLLSGPEPQRTILENLIMKDVDQLNCTCILLRGLPDSDNAVSINNNLVIHNHLLGNELNTLLLNSEYIICRSGYTSIMELLALEKKAILIATPGQTEQVFLANHLMQQNICYSVEQSQFNLLHVIEQALQFKYELPKLYSNNLEQLIPQLVESIRK
jgi:uncharacterized protein (TIGR00661 family)